MNDRQEHDGDSRLDRLEDLLLEIRESLVRHIAEESTIKPALEELVTLWKGSKLIGVILASMAAALGALLAIIEWTRAHLK